MPWRPSVTSVLIAVVGCLIALGVVILYSTSGLPSVARHADPNHFIKRQLLWIALGVVAFLVTSRLDYRLWRTLAVPLAGFSLLLLLMTLLIGVKIGGSQRWLNAGPVNVQPSELAKLTSVILIAWWMARIQRNPGSFKEGMVIPCCLVGVYAVLIILEPDFGATILIGTVGMAIMFVGGTRIGYLFLTGLVGVSTMVLLIAQDDERRGRVLAFLDPEKYAQGEAFQLTMGLYAFISGGLDGQGLGNSMQKRFYLPEAHTDFIFAILGEEWGLYGTLSVLILFLLYFLCGMVISARVEDRFGKLLAFGLTLIITIQAALNMGVVTGSLPTKGITLPFISFGGSSMLVCLAMTGMLVNIAVTAADAPGPLDRRGRSG